MSTHWAVGVFFTVLGLIAIVSCRVLGEQAAVFQVKAIKLLTGTSVQFSDGMRRFMKYSFLIVGLGFSCFGVLVLFGVITPRA